MALAANEPERVSIAILFTADLIVVSLTPPGLKAIFIASPALSLANHLLGQGIGDAVDYLVGEQAVSVTRA